MSKLLWQPSEQQIKDANITQFINYVNSNFELNLKNYHELYEWSVKEIGDFWAALWSFINVKASKSYDKVVQDLEKFPPRTKWFMGARLNFAENLLRYHDDQPAIVFYGETKGPIEISYKDLHKKVSQLSAALRNIGVKSGDRVVGYMPNIIETIMTMLATTSLGAIWSSCGAELGPDAALDRLGQVEPKVLFSVDAYWYKGKTFDQLEKVKQISSQIPSLDKTIIVPFVGENVTLDGLDNTIQFQEFLDTTKETRIAYEQVPFDHPLYIMFSSGTTGKPKCMVQGAGGILLNHVKELMLHTDMRRTDKLLYLTSPSWMMWNWMASSLFLGSTIVLYDGNPLHPDWKRIWQIIQNEGVTIFGCSASYIHYLKNIKATPGETFDLSELRQISQTGSALSDEGFDYVYEKIKEDLHFNSISGGTDINGCFAAGSPTLPVYSGELQVRALGMKVKAYNDEANHVFNEQAELVCEVPSPSMPIYFWNDPDGVKYKNAYFTHFDDKKVWRHGDFIKIHEDTGGVTFYGRSDSVLKPSGVRIGTSEIYSIVENMDEVSDSLAIGQQWKDDQRILLFIQLNENYEMTEELESKIKAELREKASPRHVPAVIMETPDIPYTFSGKKIESAVTNIIHGKTVTNKGAMRNPESLDFYDSIKGKL